MEKEQHEKQSASSQIPPEELTPPHTPPSAPAITPPARVILSPRPAPVATTPPSPIIPAVPVVLPDSEEEEESCESSMLRRKAEEKTAHDVAEFMEIEEFHDGAAKVREDEDMDGATVYESLSDDETLEKDFALVTALDRLRFRILFKRWLSGSVSELGRISPETVAGLFERRKKLTQFCKV